MPKNNLKTIHFVLVVSALNLVLFHYPFYSFVFTNVGYKSLNGAFLIASLFVLMLAVNAFVFYLLYGLSQLLGKIVLSLFFLCSSVAFYFVVTYGVIIDESMIGNVINTNYEESSGFFSFKLVAYFIFLGVLPSVLFFKVKVVRVKWKPFAATVALTLLLILSLIFANASNWLWIDKNSKKLGGLAMPWSYSVNISLYYIHQHQKNKKEIPLPDATLANNEKSIMVLVIGESARRQNFSLYGYQKNTNPLLSKTPNLYHFDATSCGTYTTAGVKCILEHTDSDELYEILPNYLYRNGVEVIWRTSNWGEPPLHIKNYQNREYLKKQCAGDACDYDEILFNGLKKQIEASKKNKILIVLHTSTSHGPTYYKKYPPAFEVFKPVCKSVELGNCTQADLINAYDNTIVYTDYLLSKLIETLKEEKSFKSAMIFVSDHGESLGEKNLYMHGLPMSMAPKEQYEIPFIVWVSDGSKILKPNKSVSQQHVFHSVLNFLGVRSPIYNEQLNIFTEKK